MVISNFGECVLPTQSGNWPVREADVQGNWTLRGFIAQPPADPKVWRRRFQPSLNILATSQSPLSSRQIPSSEKSSRSQSSTFEIEILGVLADSSKP
jgi:hypothetical protein